MFSIDLNCDMGEGMPNDAAIIPCISSVNIACGYHAGDDKTMKQTIDLALAHNVVIGAHPGFKDKTNFGRKEQQLSDEAYYDLVSEQLQILQIHIHEAGAKMHNVKPHGALYNMSAKNHAVASIIAKAAWDHNPELILYGLSNSYSIKAAEAVGLKTAAEVFADRTYMDDGSLIPRTMPNALITDQAQCVQQVLNMVRQNSVVSVNGKIIHIKADSICIHGDGINAAGFAKMIAEQLRQNNIRLKSL